MIEPIIASVVDTLDMGYFRVGCRISEGGGGGGACVTVKAKAR